MGKFDDDSFRPKLGPPRGKGSSSPRFITRVIKAASQAGYVARGQVSPGRARPGPRFGRGLVAARLARHPMSAVSRRVTIKMRMVVLARVGRRSTATHLRYLEREGVRPDGERGHAYGKIHDEVDLKEFERRGQGDRHQFRFIVSAEDGTELKDLKSFTRDLMTQMERDLGTRLEWIAVDHWDTEHPHTHIVLRGKDQYGKDLLIAREYITHGMRARAIEITTEWLGPRTRQDLDAAAEREVRQERWTGLDAKIERESREGLIDANHLSAMTGDARQRTLILGRLNHLTTMGLAEDVQPGVWRVSPKAPEVLRAMGERGDIVRTMQRTIGRGARDYQVFDSANASHGITGRIVGKGLHDELYDRGYLIIEGVDGRAHYAALAGDVDFTALPMGAIVKVQAAATRSSDRNIAGMAEDSIYRVHDHLARLQTSPSTNRDPEAFVQAHVRRLEALRRGGVVERISEGVWKIPADLPEKGRAFDLQRLGGASVELCCHLPIERQTRALGATWLDQQLIQGAKSFPNTEFGTSIRDALKEREDFLVDQGLARRQGLRVLLAQNLLVTLRDREIADATTRLESSTGLVHRPAIDGARVSGTYRESIQLASGRFAMLDDGVGFSLVPWRPVIDKRLGQDLTAVIQGARVSWELGRSRTLSL